VKLMDGSVARYHCSVVREAAGPGYVDVALIRRVEPHGVLERLRRHERRGAVVLYHRTFRPLLELAELEAYAAQLERTAEHANVGTLGCFVETEQREAGIVRVALYERWFDGRRLHCERLAGRDFDASDESAVVASSELLAELRAWAEERNEDRETSEASAAAEETARTERSSERTEAADQLARILASLNEHS
jgi:hypothetical protein